ncbi:MAG: pyridoxal phosphate-dependent aminotransferase, partial [Rhodobacteraceae bacterium]|nr:pyridoxal phosphate-dependent aminotransferase [Paracoccaceae bacterium]
ARGAAFVARLGANESVFGPSPAAVAAMAGAAAGVWRYGDPEAFDLRAAIAAHHGVAPACVMVGEGIDALLGNLVRLLVAEGDPVVTSAGAYPTFDYHVAGFGGVLHAVPYRCDAEDPGALLAAARETGARLVYLANPDNPMGSWRTAAEVMALVAGLPEGAVLCLDEAYADFAPPAAIPALDLGEPRVIRMRTFSKAYGLAGARVGYALGEAGLIAAFDRVRNHFGVNRIGQAGALAALADHGWLRRVLAEAAAAKDRIGSIAAEHGLRALSSATNFVAIDCGRDGAFARAVLAGLIDGGVFVRMPFGAPQDRCIRVTAGRPQDLDAFAEALPQALAQAASA